MTSMQKSEAAQSKLDNDGASSMPSLGHDDIKSNVALEFVRIIPSIGWILAAIFAVYVFYQPIKDTLARNQIRSIAIGIVQLELEKLPATYDSNDSLNMSQVQTIADRASRFSDKLRGAKILWVDDKNPAQNIRERVALESLGVQIDLAVTTKDAIGKVHIRDSTAHPYDVIITDMKRENDESAKCQGQDVNQKDLENAGCDLLRKLAASHGDDMPQVIVYAAGYDPQYGTPPFAFGMTNRSDELMHLVLDALERRDRL